MQFFLCRGTCNKPTGPDSQRSKCIALLWIEAEFDLFTVVASYVFNSESLITSSLLTAFGRAAGSKKSIRFGITDSRLTILFTADCLRRNEDRSSMLLISASPQVVEVCVETIDQSIKQPLSSRVVLSSPIRKALRDSWRISIVSSES